MEILVLDVAMNLQKYLGRSAACFSHGDRSRDGCQSGARRPIGGVMPHTKGVMPHTKGVMPHTKGVMPHTKGVLPHVNQISLGCLNVLCFDQVTQF